MDGTYGRKLFYEARGYTVTDCYNQKTDNTITGGFSFAQYKAEIDAGRPVMLNLAGHTIVGVGYDDTGSTVYIHDTWSNSDHTMTWGGSYAGMALLSVSIVNLQESTPGIPGISVSPNLNNFGNVKISDTSTQTFTISSVGTGNLILGNITIDGAQASEFILDDNNCFGRTLTPSEACTLAVTFAPTVLGAHSAVLEILSTDPVSSTLQVVLSGAGDYEATPSLLEGTLGTAITYSDAPSGFGTKKGKVSIGGLKQKVATWTPTSISVIFTKYKGLATDTPYDVSIQPKEPKGTPPINLPGAFTLKKPEIDPSTTDSTGAPGTEATIKGLWFGTKKGKVYLGTQKCKVTEWTMNPATGESTIIFEVHKKLGTGNYELSIENKIGQSLSFGFEVK